MTTVHSPPLTRIRELLTIVLHSEPIPELINLSHVCSEFRYTAKYIIRMHIQKCLAPFIPPNRWKSFFHLLKTSRAAIAGSVALAVLSPDPRQWLPDNLNIVVPLGRSNQWSHFLLAAKFIELPTHDITSGKFSIVNTHINASIRRFKAPETIYCDPCHAHMHTSFENGNIVVIIESAQQSILLPILSSPTTAQMNFITHNQLFCPYPTLTVKKLALCSYQGNPNYQSTIPKLPTYRQFLNFELKNMHLLLGNASTVSEALEYFIGLFLTRAWDFNGASVMLA
ncbi:hypothetical protein IW261DRAFT_1576177 [Armillaria novae-zelandiae]|uniref:Uncharacterized protein n=1 Tax=Armillaria novae-zelandiae TaxID=153914 RepID=A0AA39NBU8_9AGAR|nr:hypothetical protein IW261DRAFT_1576177 [Armillaria novae-zelandiae]